MVGLRPLVADQKVVALLHAHAELHEAHVALARGRVDVAGDGHDEERLPLLGQELLQYATNLALHRNHGDNLRDGHVREHVLRLVRHRRVVVERGAGARVENLAAYQAIVFDVPAPVAVRVRPLVRRLPMRIGRIGLFVLIVAAMADSRQGGLVRSEGPSDRLAADHPLAYPRGQTPHPARARLFSMVLVPMRMRPPRPLVLLFAHHGQRRVVHHHAIHLDEGVLELL
mmetsp:Transcript_27148/g.63450  ORF Transcript_27148/g.63450 Transcript_27148/m.63450 type:complete len:228 (-) Transcript_27148:2323-3006(-)